MSEARRRPLVEDVVHNLRRASFTAHATFRSALDARELSMGQFVVLRTLGVDGRATTKGLARATGVTAGNITGLVDKLEAEGLIVRNRSAKDRRIVYLEATKKGQTLLGELRRAVVAEAAKGFESWTRKDLERLNDLLCRVINPGSREC